MKTITYNPETHVLVPRDLIADAKQIFCSDVEPNTNGDCLDVIEWFNAMMAAAPQPEPNPNWCAGCSPDNCSGCGTAPLAYITPQHDRTAELEAALKVARDALDEAVAGMGGSYAIWKPKADKALAKINEVLK